VYKLPHSLCPIYSNIYRLSMPALERRTWIYNTAAISAKATGFAIFARPAAQQPLRPAGTAVMELLALKPGNPGCLS
jgi:hypothetical protein